MKRRKVLSISTKSLLGSTFGLSAIASTKHQEIEMERKLKIIVMGAHPDDPETGCGGTMSLLSEAGHMVVSAYLTRGEAGIPGKSYEESARIRTEEAEKACEILNAKSKFLGQTDGNCVVNKEQYEKTRQFFKDEEPDLVFTHWPIDTHRDHQACSILVYDAWLRLGKPFTLYYFEVMTGKQSQHFSPTDYINIESVIAKKHEACFVHKSQHIREKYANEHEKMEIFRGLEAGCKFAEAFVRHVQNPNMPNTALNPTSIR